MQTMQPIIWPGGLPSKDSIKDPLHSGTLSFLRGSHLPKSPWRNLQSITHPDPYCIKMCRTFARTWLQPCNRPVTRTLAISWPSDSRRGDKEARRLPVLPSKPTPTPKKYWGLDLDKLKSEVRMGKLAHHYFLSVELLVIKRSTLPSDGAYGDLGGVVMLSASDGA